MQWTSGRYSCFTDPDDCTTPLFARLLRPDYATLGAVDKSSSSQISPSFSYAAAAVAAGGGAGAGAGAGAGKSAGKSVYKATSAIKDEYLSNWLLLQQPTSTDPSGSRIQFYTAIKEGHVQPVRKMLEEGGAHYNPNPSRSGATEATPLIIATDNGHPDLVRLLLEHKADPNRTTAEFGQSVRTVRLYT